MAFRRLGTESSPDSQLEGRVTSEPVSEMGFSGAGELRSDSNTFMDDGRKRKGTISGPNRPEFWFCPSTGLLRRYRFKILNTLLFFMP
jgi:hypothetical protein